MDSRPEKIITPTPYVDAVTLSSSRSKKRKPRLGDSLVSFYLFPDDYSPSEERQKEVFNATSIIPNATAALSFKEFSWREPNGSYRRNLALPGPQQMALNSYLADNFGAIMVDISPPFLALYCDPLPEEQQRPFSIAGLITIWFNTSLRGSLSTVNLCIGDFSPPEGADCIPLPEAHAEDLKGAREVFPECEAILYVRDGMVVELPRMDRAEFGKRLESLPDLFQGIYIGLDYHNGLLQHTEVKEPDYSSCSNTSQTDDFDETDYIEKQGRFFPGTQITSIDPKGESIGCASTGILIEQGMYRRFMVKYHLAPQLSDGLIGDMSTDDKIYRIIEGGGGSAAGRVREKVKGSHIALANLTRNIRNEIIGMDVTHQKLLRSDEVKINDEFIIEDHVTGVRRLRHVGMRCEFARESGACEIKTKQDLHLTNCPEITALPWHRQPVCGSVLLRCSKVGDERSVDEVIKDGEVAGILNLPDLESEGHLEICSVSQTLLTN